MSADDDATHECGGKKFVPVEHHRDAHHKLKAKDAEIARITEEDAKATLDLTQRIQQLEAEKMQERKQANINGVAAFKAREECDRLKSLFESWKARADVLIGERDLALHEVKRLVLENEDYFLRWEAIAKMNATLEDQGAFWKHRASAAEERAGEAERLLVEVCDAAGEWHSEVIKVQGVRPFPNRLTDAVVKARAHLELVKKEVGE